MPPSAWIDAWTAPSSPVENTLLKARLAEVEAALADAKEAQQRLESIATLLRREKFGARSEKLPPDQFNLPLEDVELAQAVLEAAQEKAEAAPNGKSAGDNQRPRRNRGHLPAISREWSG